jgi:50S ribosomal subunit-associated GTPase HflX
LDAGGIPAILLFNKADRLGPAERRRFREEGRLLASAAQGNGLGAFLRSVEEALEKGGEEREFLLPHARRDLLPLLYGAGRVLKEKSVEGGVLVRARLDPQNWGRLDKELGRFR